MEEEVYMGAEKSKIYTKKAKLTNSYWPKYILREIKSDHIDVLAYYTKHNNGKNKEPAENQKRPVSQYYGCFK